jgi:putative transposase
LRLIQKNKEK